MTLRRKLLIAFGGLAATALLAAAVALAVALRWQATSGEVENHYQRSLLLQRVRAETFQALAEVNDALAGNADEALDARRDFERAIAPSRTVFREWASLADTDRERAEVREVRTAHERLLADARRVFDLVDAGRRPEAIRLVDDQLDTGDYAAFRDLTERVVAYDLQRRGEVRADTLALRRSAGIMATIAILAALSFTLLIAAYLANDIFRPLGRLRAALDSLADGVVGQRLDAERNDEIGEVARAYNRAAQALERREMVAQSAGACSAAGQEAPSGKSLHQLIARLQASLARLRAAGPASEALAEAEHVARIVCRLAGLGFPVGLRLEECDPRLLAQEALNRIGPELAARGFSSEIALDPAASRLLADRLMLCGALNELVGRALAASPEQGGRIGIRLQGEHDTGMIHFDIADEGRGPEGAPLRDDPVEGRMENGEEVEVGLVMVRDIAERHGGRLELFSEPGKGSVARLSLPWRS
nr:ATP-binding protein [uncultured Sphingomonas sp.]